MKNTQKTNTVQHAGNDNNWTTFRGGNVPARTAACYLGITLRELKGLRARRAIAFYRIGHRTVTYNLKELEAFLKKCRVAPAGEAIGAGWNLSCDR